MIKTRTSFEEAIKVYDEASTDINEQINSAYDHAENAYESATKELFEAEEVYFEYQGNNRPHRFRI